MTRAFPARKGPRAWRSGSVDLTTARNGELLNDDELPEGMRTILVAVLGGQLSAGQLYLGFDAKEKAKADAALAVIDAGTWRRINLDRETTRIFLYHAALVGVTVEITALEGDADEGTGGTAPAPVPPGGGAPGANVNAAVVIGAGSATVLAANPNRRAFEVLNSGGVPAALGFGAPAVFADDFLIQPGQAYGQEGELVYRGDVRAITGGAAGEVRVLEFI